jgi:hypothetical protein
VPSPAGGGRWSATQPEEKGKKRALATSTGRSIHLLLDTYRAALHANMLA